MDELVEKQVNIARSGIQKYLKRELGALKVGPVPSQHKDKTEFSVYRSAPLIADSKDLFTKKPLIYTHKAYIDPANFTEHVQGWIGDVATVELNADKTEAVIRADLTIGGGEALDAYQNRGEREVSPMYFGKFVWKDGVAPDGSPYEIEMIELTGVNHVALVPAGRGGSDAAIIDHGPNFLSQIWRAVRRMVGVKDELPETFRVKLTEIAKARKSYTIDQIEQAARPLWDCIRDMSWTDELGLLNRYLGDIKGLIDADDEAAGKYVQLVSDLYEKLDKESLSEVLKENKVAVAADAKAKDEKETAMDKEEEEKKAKAEAAAKDEDKGWEDLMARMKKSREDGAKASDWKMGASKDADEESEEEKKKKAEAEKAAKDKAAAKDAEENERKEAAEKAKKEEEEKAKAADARAAVYDSAPWSVRIEDSAPMGDDPAARLLAKQGYGPGKEKK